jgi:hypothetical protein
MKKNNKKNLESSKVSSLQEDDWKEEKARKKW